VIADLRPPGTGDRVELASLDVIDQTLRTMRYRQKVAVLDGWEIVFVQRGSHACQPSKCVVGISCLVPVEVVRRQNVAVTRIVAGSEGELPRTITDMNRLSDRIGLKIVVV